ncbi:MAG: response regulator transcription factor [Thermodesulfovibrionales bacterium]|nr:response regulator transcription factor [Thermodesulfovibrionales bacterium]
MGTNILINIKNKIVSELLNKFISGICPEYRICNPENRDDPDLVIVDPETVKDDMKSRFSNTKVLLLDFGTDEKNLIDIFLLYKIDGIISANTDLDLFKKALRVVCEDQIWIENKYIKLMKETGLLLKSNRPGYISRREAEILQLLKEGLSNKEIAAKLSLSDQTVKTHLSRIFKKFNVSSRSQLITNLLKDKLI